MYKRNGGVFSSHVKSFVVAGGCRRWAVVGGGCRRWWSAVWVGAGGRRWSGAVGRWSVAVSRAVVGWWSGGGRARSADGRGRSDGRRGATGSRLHAARPGTDLLPRRNKSVRGAPQEQKVLEGMQCSIHAVDIKKKLLVPKLRSEASSFRKACRDDAGLAEARMNTDVFYSLWAL